ncbi:MAG: ubiquinone/menaquinone biosynthesis methyltransferase [Bacteroidota bacterium]|nr:ubiquinone/menaquinone biosynthesis methyltransferase [Bacteroidota bacterium]
MDLTVNIDKSKKKIELMFDEIAPSYDRLNHLFTMNLDLRWRKEIINYIKRENFPADNILDVASGTGDLTLELLSLDAKKIYASDISVNMLKIQKSKITDNRLKLIKADASNLPFENDYFDIVTIGFGVRNFDRLEKSLNEIKRVIKPGGKVVILEMFKTSGFGTKLFNIYFGKVMPYFGNKISKSKYAYSYLFRSVDSFLKVNDFIKLCSNSGFKLEHHKNNFLGIVNTLYLTESS